MKPPTGEPSESVLRYFTRPLYRQFNSLNDEEADRADAAWEDAIRAYREHLAILRGRLPAHVVKLAELCLHDGEVLSRVEEIQPGGLCFPRDLSCPVPLPLWSAVGIVSVARAGTLVSLIYGLWDRVRVHPAPSDWPFSKVGEQWLYDEIDWPDERGPFVHRILLSTGIVLEIPFHSVVIHQLALPAGGSQSLSRQTA